MEIIGTTLRVCVDDLESATAFYENLTGSRAQRSGRGAVSAAAVGCFLLLSGPESELEVLRRIGATIAVDDLDKAHAALTGAGARVIAGPVESPQGRMLIAVHPDGSAFEYVDRGPGRTS
jgi:predicted enzyme related to lactoylglutathione lyase